MTSSSESDTRSDARNDDVSKRRTSSPRSRKSDSSILDLRTTQGQILFLIISIALSLLIQSLPNDAFRNIFNSDRSNNALNIDAKQQQQQHQLLHSNDCNASNALVNGSETKKLPTYWIYSRNGNEKHLKHVINVADRLGYNKVTNETDNWDLLWAHDYPFRALYPKMHHLKPHQRVNHFPGCGFITNKVDLATTESKYVPKSFRLPEDREKFMEYIELNPKTLFVQKNNQHRHINIKGVDEINFSDNGTFLQEYVDNPLLVDGHKFDIGVYVIITSIDPLRVYIYKGDILFRYCPQKYYPFDSKNVNKYIVGDDYLPVWDVPSLSTFYNGFGFGMKESFDAYLRSKKRDPSVIWQQVDDAIRSILLLKEKHIINALKQYRNKRNFFEMMRFDLIINDHLRVYLMEANMSPNLSSSHFQQNTLLYEQVIYNLMNLVGIGSPIYRESLRTRTNDVEQMMSSDKNIAVFAEHCASGRCSESCEYDECKLCRPCLSSQDIIDLHTAYREHINRGDTKRIFPVAMTASEKPNLENLSDKNRWMTNWFAGKCSMDSTWCS